MTHSDRTPSEITAGLEGLGVAMDFRRLVDELAATESLTADAPTAGYVGVRPSNNGTISLYVHTSSLSVALDPKVARRAAERFGGSLQQKNPTTWFLRFTAAAVGQHFPDVLELARAAVAKSEAGPPYEGGKAAAQAVAAARSICPSCRNFELAGNGTCLCGYGED